MRKRNVLWGAILSVMTAACLCSCMREEYDLNRPLDMTMQIGGDSLSLPLGSTGRLTIDSLLGSESFSDILAVNEAGEYILSLDALSVSEELDDVPIQAFLLDSIGTLQEEEVRMTLSGASMAPQAVRKASAMAGDVYQEIDLDFNFDGISEEIHSLQYMYFVEKTRVRVLFELSDVPEQIDLARVRPDLVLQLPEDFYINDPLVDENNRIRVQSFDAGAGRFSFDFSLDGMDLSKTEWNGRNIHHNSTLVLSGKLFMEEENASSLLSSPQSETEFTLRTKVLYSAIDVEPRRVKGIFSLSMPPQRLSVEFGQMPEMLTSPDAILDFARPHILINLATNTGVAVNAHLKIVPVYGATPDESLTQQVALQIPAGDVDNMHTYRFWLAKDREGMPQDCLFEEMDVSAFLKRMPDSLQVWVDVMSDMTQVHEYVFGKTAVLDAAIRPEVPLAFGPDLYIPYSNTISGMEGQIGSLLDGNQMEVIAEVSNGLPLGIQIKLDMLDADGETIPICTTGEQMIQACADPQQPRLSVVSFGFSGRDNALQGREISSLRLNCSLLSDEKSAGLPVRKTSYFQAKLKARFPGGILLDINKNDE